MLHTLVLGSIKYLLKIWMPTLSKVQKKEVLARVKAFSTSGFKVRMYGNVFYYYQSFVGRDFKDWAQMAVDDAQIEHFQGTVQCVMLPSCTKIVYI